MKLAMIGCGNMGTAYIKSLLKNEVLTRDELILIDKNDYRTNYLNAENLGGVITNELVEDISMCDIVVVAVKPQFFKEVAVELSPKLREGQVIISIMAGVKMETMKGLLKINTVVRAMPNTPCQLGMGVTGYTADESVSKEGLKLVDAVLKSTGRTVYVDDETLMDAVTALSGSGPAYFFTIVKSMIEAGVEMGLKESTAALLVKQTMFGSYHLMNHSDKPLGELIDAVTSKGGTTQAALTVFDNQELDKTIKKALWAARDRGQELSEG